MAKRKPTIQQAASAFAARGDRIIGAAPWKPGATETRYNVEVGGKRRVMSASQISASMRTGKLPAAVSRQLGKKSKSKWVNG